MKNMIRAFVIIVVALAAAVVLSMNVEAKAKTYKSETIRGTVEYQIINPGKKGHYAKVKKCTPNAKGEMIIGSIIKYKYKGKTRKCDVKCIEKNAFKKATKMKTCRIYCRLTYRLNVNFGKCKKLYSLYVGPYEGVKINPNTLKTLREGCTVNLDQATAYDIQEELKEKEIERLIWEYH